MAAAPLHLNSKSLINSRKINEAEVTQNTAASETPSTLAAPTMRLLIYILISAITQNALGQFRADTIISKRALDSLQFALFQQKETINQMQWACQMKVNVKRVDSLKIRQDSVVVNHLSGEGKIIKQEILSYDTKGCLSLSDKRYFNNKGNVAYAESWKFSCEKPPKVNDDEFFFSGLRVGYQRMKYDEQGRIVLRVFWHSTPMTRRITYSYDSAGKQNQNRERIAEYEFWN
jgi:hypothetical protein